MLDLDVANLPPMSFSSGVGSAAQGLRADEAEAIAGHWVLNCGYNLTVPEVGIKGFDLIANSRKIQIKQRTRKHLRDFSWKIDGLRPNSFERGLVHEFILFETLAPEHELLRIFQVDAEHVFNSGLLYFSEYNQRNQITSKRFTDICEKFGRIITLNEH